MARSTKRATIRNQLIAARPTLEAARVALPWLDAEVLLSHTLGHDRSWLHAHSDRPLTSAEGRHYRTLIERRAAHIPVAYLTGEREFYGYVLRVSPAVMIPRPETELLVELALAWLHAHPQARRVIDLGTGSGAVAIAIAKGAPSVRVIAIDKEPRALAQAAANIARLRVASRVEIRRSDLLSGAPTADLIAANLPYLSEKRLRDAGPELSFEPVAALDGGRDGLDAIRRAMAQAPTVLRPGGCLLFECDPPQSRPIERLARREWGDVSVTIHKDLAGRDRVVQIQV